MDQKLTPELKPELILRAIKCSHLCEMISQYLIDFSYIPCSSSILNLQKDIKSRKNNPHSIYFETKARLFIYFTFRATRSRAARTYVFMISEMGGTKYRAKCDVFYVIGILPYVIGIYVASCTFAMMHP